MTSARWMTKGYASQVGNSCGNFSAMKFLELSSVHSLHTILLVEGAYGGNSLPQSKSMRMNRIFHMQQQKSLALAVCHIPEVHKSAGSLLRQAFRKLHPFIISGNAEGHSLVPERWQVHCDNPSQTQRGVPDSPDPYFARI